MNEIFILKTEKIFPDWLFFKRLNKLIWKNKVKYVNKFCKKNNLFVICDYETSLLLKDVNYKYFGDYVEYENIYKISREYSKKIIKLLDIWEIGDMVEEELAYTLLEPIDNLDLLQNIRLKEKPKNVYCFNSIFGDYVKEVFPLTTKTKKFWGQKLIRNITGYLFYKIRFHNFPLINRKEFVKTKNKFTNNKEVLALGIDDLFYGRIENVIKGFENTLVLCTNKNTQNNLREKNIDFISLGDCLTKKDIKKIKRNFRDFIQKMNKIKNSEKFKNKLYYKEYNLLNVIEYEICYLINKRMVWVLLYYEAYKNIINNFNIKCIIGINDLIPITRSAVMVGKELGVPSLVIQNGVAEDDCGRGFIPLYANKIAVWGKEVKKYLIKLGINKDKIVVTGSPKLKKPLVNLKEEEVRKFIETDKPYIVIATQEFGGLFGEKEKEVFLRDVINVAKEIKDKNFIIKLHPRDNSSIALNLINEMKPTNIKIVKNIDIIDLLNYSVGLITIFSTSIIESMLLGKNSISYNPCGRPEVVPYRKYNSVIYAENKKELETAINSISKEINFDSFLDNYCSINQPSNKKIRGIINEFKKN